MAGSRWAKDEPQFFTVAEVAQYLRISENSLRNMIDRGEGPPIRKFGRLMRIYRPELEAWIDRGEPAEPQNSGTDDADSENTNSAE